MDHADAADRPTTINPFPDLRDLYLLVAGVLLGVVLSPLVLGQLAPGAYDALFRGGGEAWATVAEADREIDAQLRELEATGVTDVALAEHRARRIEETLPQRLEAMQARWQREMTIAGWMTALVLAAAATMAIEAVVSPSPRDGRALAVPATLGRLATVRYALLAVWLALAIAQPTLLQRMPLAFLVGVLVVALAAGLVPLGRSR